MINGRPITKKWMAVNVLPVTNAAKNPANRWMSNLAGDPLRGTKVCEAMKAHTHTKKKKK